MCQIIVIDLNFYLQKCLEIFDKKSADKIQSKNYKEVNPPCLMPIRVKPASIILARRQQGGLSKSLLSSGVKKLAENNTLLNFDKVWQMGLGFLFEGTVSL